MSRREKVTAKKGIFHRCNRGRDFREISNWGRRLLSGLVLGGKGEGGRPGKLVWSKCLWDCPSTRLEMIRGRSLSHLLTRFPGRGRLPRRIGEKNVSSHGLRMSEGVTGKNAGASRKKGQGERGGKERLVATFWEKGGAELILQFRLVLKGTDVRNRTRLAASAAFNTSI